MRKCYHGFTIRISEEHHEIFIRSNIWDLVHFSVCVCDRLDIFSFSFKYGKLKFVWIFRVLENVLEDSRWILSVWKVSLIIISWTCFCLFFLSGNINRRITNSQFKRKSLIEPLMPQIAMQINYFKCQF